MQPSRAPLPVEDEEARVHAFGHLDRRLHGVYFTPAPLVQLVLERLAPYLPETAPLAVIDPACGAGAFLSRARELFPQARQFGLELDSEVAASTRARLPGARIEVGNALQGGLAPLLAPLSSDTFEVWVGNPPWNGTSPLLRQAEAYARVRALLPPRFSLPPGTSLRDDFAFFLLIAAERLRVRKGALAFLTPSSLLDSFLYAPVREALLETLTLREAIELGPGQFRQARVSTCLTIWTSPRQSSSAVFLAADGRLPAPLSTPQPLEPRSPAFLMRAVDSSAAALDSEWQGTGEPITTLIPVSFPGLKTRFDSLLVDEDPERLYARVSDFLVTPASELSAFGDRHGIDPKLLPKLLALKQYAPVTLTPERARLRPFIRYAGARHRGRVPEDAWSWCYLDRRLIPRGDHRLQLLKNGSEYDPHREPTKLIFNVRERPLSAALVDQAGCVHAHRHARFAPLLVPRGLRDGLRDFDPEELVPNLSGAGLALAEKLGSPRAVFEAVVRFINGDEVQRLWAPAFGAHRLLPIPLPKI